MKKMSKILALITAGAFVFGGMFTSCKDSDDEGGDSTVTATENTVKGTYTMTGGDMATGESYTLVFEGGKVYLKIDLADIDGSDDDDDSSGTVTYTLSYTSSSTAHTPSCTDEDFESETFWINLGSDVTAIYYEVGAYTISDGVVSGTMEEDPVTTTTDSSGHLTSLTATHSGDDAESVVWDFTGSDKYNIGTTESETAIVDADLDPTSGSGATLHIDYVKGKYKEEGDISGWYIGKDSAYVAGDSSKAKARFTVTLTSAATLSIVTTGNGNTDLEKRWVYVVDSTGTEISGVEAATNLSSDNVDTTLSNDLAAGTYQIWMSGNRLYKISVE